MANAGTIPEPRESFPKCQWADGQWMSRRGERFNATRPVSIYEVHLGSWMRVPEENHRVLTYRELAPKLADYAGRMGYTHVLLLDASDSTPEELMHLVNHLHQHGVGVLVDWKVPSIEAAKAWVEEFHVDGLCMADILGTDFVRRLAAELHVKYPDLAIIGEGAHAAFKLDPGFAHDIRSYLAHTPADRKLHHNRLTFRRMYAFQEKYILPLSHRELAPLMRMPGDEWQKFANLRLLLAYMFLQPGKKLLFMGHDFGQWREWNSETSLDWHLTQLRYHQGIQNVARRLNDVYFHERALHESDAKPECFEWIDCEDAQGGTISWLRWDAHFNEVFLALFNFTPRVHRNFKVGVPRGGAWREVINTDAQEYGGSGQGNFGYVKAAPFGWHGRPHSIFITVPPLAAVAFKSEEGK
jgi:1,4-alpha-glucan branching enzyme